MYAGLVEDASTSLPPQPSSTTKNEPQQRRGQKALAPDHIRDLEAAAVSSKGIVGYGPYEYNSLRCFIKAVECEINNAEAWDNVGTSLRGPKEAVIIRLRRGDVRVERGERILSPTAKRAGEAATTADGNEEDIVFEDEDEDDIVDVVFSQQLCFIRAIEIDPFISSCWNKLGTTIPSGAFDIRGTDATGTNTYVTVDLSRHLTPFAASEAEAAKERREIQKTINSVAVARGEGVAIVKPKRRISTSSSVSFSSSAAADQEGAAVGILRFNKRECFARAIALDMRNAHAWYNLASLLTIKKMTIATMLTQGVGSRSAALAANQNHSQVLQSVVSLMGAPSGVMASQASGVFPPAASSALEQQALANPLAPMYGMLTAANAGNKFLQQLTLSKLNKVDAIATAGTGAEDASSVASPNNNTFNRDSSMVVPSPSITALLHHTATDAVLAANSMAALEGRVVPTNSSLSISGGVVGRKVVGGGASLGVGVGAGGGEEARKDSVAISSSTMTRGGGGDESTLVVAPDDPYLATIIGPYGRKYYFDKKQCLVKVLECEPEDPFAWYNLSCVMKRGETVDITVRVFVDDGGDTQEKEAKGEEKAALGSGGGDQGTTEETSKDKGALAIGAIAALGRADELLEREKERRERRQERETQMLQRMTADGLSPTTASPKSLLEKIKQSREETAAATRTTSSSSKVNSNKAVAATQSDNNNNKNNTRQQRRHKRRKTALKTISITAKDCCINALRASNFTDFYAWTKLGQVLGNSDTAVLAVKDPLSPTLEVVESKVTGRDCFLEALHLNPMYPNAWDGLATTLGKTEKVTFVHPEHSMWNIKYRETLLHAAKENNKAGKDGEDAAPSSPTISSDKPIVIVGTDKVTGAPIFSTAAHEQQATPKPSTIVGKNSTSTTDAAGAPQQLTEVLNNAGCWNKAIECDERYTMAWSNLGYTMGKTEKYTVLSVPRSQRDCFLAGIGCDDKGINDKAWNGLGINLKSNEQLTLTEDPSRPPPPPPAEPGSGLEELVAKDITNNKKIGKKEAYGRSVLANPYNSSAWNNLGTTLGNTGSVVIDGVELYEQDCYLRAVTLNPNNSAGWDNLGSTVGNKKGVKKANDDDMLLGEGDGDETASVVSGGARSNSALTATVLVAGIPYTRQQCFLKAVNCNKNNSSAWGKLCGTLKGDETVTVAGVSYDRLQCVLRALACDFDNSRAWNRLGRLIDTGAYGTKEPHAVHIAAHNATLEKEKAAATAVPKLTKEDAKEERAGAVNKAGNDEDTDEKKTKLKKRAEEEADAMIMEDSDDADEDDDLPSDAADAAEKEEKRRRTKAKLNGLLTPDPFADLEPYVEVQGKPFHARDCYARACESDSSYTIAWINLGAAVEGGGEVVTVKGKPYQKKNCFIKALEAEEANAATWNSLGAALTAAEEVVVSGKKFTKLKCYARALELLPGNSAAWVNVGSMLMSPAEVVANEIAAAQYKQLQLQMQQQSSPRNTNGAATAGTTTSGRPLSGARSRPSSAKAIPNGAARPLSAKPNNKLQQTSVEVEGVTYSQLDCFVEAIKGDFNNGAAWSGLGALLADDPDTQYEFSDGKVSADNTAEANNTAAPVSKVAADFLPPSLKDVPILYDSVPQLQNMLNAQPLPLSKAAQQRLAAARASHPTPLTVSIRGEAYTKQMCYVRAVECARQSSVAWNNLGTTIVSAEEAEERRKVKRGGAGMHGNNEDTNIAGGGDNGGDDDRPLPTGTATVNGRTYSKCDCYLKAVLLDGKSAVAWVNLGSAMSDTDVVQYNLNTNNKNKNNTGAGEEENTSGQVQQQEGGAEAEDSLVPSVSTTAPVLLSRTEVLSKAVELEPYNSCAWLVFGLLGSFESSRVRTANPHVFANNLSTASTSSQHGRNEELERLGIPTVRIGGDELTQLDCFISAVEADPANLRAWGEIAKLMRYETDDGQPPASASSSPRGDKQRNSTTNSISAEDVLHPREVEINGTLYTKAQIEAKIVDAKTPAHPHQVPLSMGMMSGSGVRLPPRGASARRQRQE